MAETRIHEDEKQEELKEIYSAVKENETVKRTDRFKKVIGKSRAIRDVLTLVEKVKNTDSTVLITGESGTGKELVARAIHDNSPRSSNRFVAVNVAVIPETLMASELFGYKKGTFTDGKEAKAGLFKTANKGTIFLDEIGDMDIASQVKLLRVLQEREIRPLGETKPSPIDVRVIAATNKNLEEAVREKEFREDLYYRIKVITIHLPALRERKEDIPELVEHIVDHIASRFRRTKKSVSVDAMEKMLLHDWPGNVRSLENCLEEAFILADGNVIGADHINLPLLEAKTESQGLDATEKQLIISILRRSRTFAEAARRLKWTRQKLYRLCTKRRINYKHYLGSDL